MADGVYKVGRTQQDYGTHLKRLKSYPADSVIVYVRKVDNEQDIERVILAMFVQKFGKHPRGSEYFIGDEKEMIRIIDSVLDPKIPLEWWDGQPTNLRFMIREIHKALGKRHFKFEDLYDQLTKLGYSVDVKTGEVHKLQ